MLILLAKEYEKKLFFLIFSIFKIKYYEGKIYHFKYYRKRNLK